MSGCQLWLIAFAPDYKDKQTCCTGHQNSDERVAQPVGFHLPGRCHFFFFHDHSPGISGDGFAHLTDPFLILGSCPGFSSGSNEVTQSGIVANKLRTGRSITVHQFRMQGSDVFLGPKPDGTIEEQAVDRVTTIGKWLDKNGEAIYATVNARKYNDGNVWFTQSKDGKKMYAMYALEEDDPEVPAVIEWTGNIPAGKKVTLLSTGKRVKCEVDGDRVKVYLPKHVDRTESLAFSFGIK